MSKSIIIIISIPKIEPSSMSSLPISTEEEPQCVLQLFLLGATWLKNYIKSFVIDCESITCRRERVKLESRNKILVEIKGESRIGQK
jgi:hypothetical protein